MSWAKFDDEYDDNPKVRAAGKDGRALDQVGIRYCAKHRTDGLIPDHDLPILVAKAEVPLKRTLRRLIEVGRWHGPGNDCDHAGCVCPAGHHVVHDYLDFNPTAAKAADKSRKRSEAGRKGGLRSRPPRHPAESTSEANASANAQATENEETEHTRSNEGTPSPYHAVADYSSSSDSPGAPPGRDDDDASAHASSDQHDLGPTVEAALRILAQADLDERQHLEHLDRIGDPTSWLNTAHDRRRASDGARLVELAALDPDAAPEQLVDALTADRPTSAGPVPGGDMVNHTYDDQQRAQLDRAATGLDRVREVLDIEPPPEGRFRSAIAAARDAVDHHARPEAQAS